MNNESKTADAHQASYEREVLKVLLDEFTDAQRLERPRKLKRRLREKGLGPFDVNRVEKLQVLKDELILEIDKDRSSSFFTERLGRAAHLEDWNVDGLCHHLSQEHPTVSMESIRWFVPWALYQYYLR